MPKGKQFNAAEKHFLKKIEIKNKELKEVRSFNSKLIDENTELKNKINELQKINENNQIIIDELRKINNMSEDDIKDLLKGRRALESIIELLTNKSLFGGTYL